MKFVEFIIIVLTVSIIGIYIFFQGEEIED